MYRARAEVLVQEGPLGVHGAQRSRAETHADSYQCGSQLLLEWPRGLRLKPTLLDFFS